MDLWIQVLYAIALLTFPAACLLLHLRLRNRASALLLFALGANALWIGWGQSALTLHLLQPASAAEHGAGINAAVALDRLDEFDHAQQTLAACDAALLLLLGASPLLTVSSLKFPLHTKE
ncbi:hypothetical protein [Pseudoxanthomonas sp. Root630]|uniref:hypothetical protein n=1 Tax=Pseudoxanthomonas sp. Root630 TaxID=1736574 RepID=UPI0007031033|nr:hypothetical protein [Pseudoxanthomonas sp. Root630]KRA41581.1 hypothetical protein ASD72_16065 [Pseudoxanthomonas sp. Root630]